MQKPLFILAGLIFFFFSFRGDCQLVDPNTASGTEIDLGGGMMMRFVMIQSGTFVLGSPDNEPGRDSSEGPQHRVDISKPFFMAATEVTQEQYGKLIGTNPSFFVPTETSYSSGYVDTGTQPVEMVSWFDALRFCNALSVQQKRTPCYLNQLGSTTVLDSDTVTCNWNADGFRLPTEAEWEYACRANATTTFYWGSEKTESVLKDNACCYNNCYDDGWTDPHAKKGGTQPVGLKLPNPFGLYDMSGNIWEWCWDWHGSYTTDVATDPRGLATGSQRVNRGGGWGSEWDYCRSAVRSMYDPTGRGSSMGFRPVWIP